MSMPFYASAEQVMRDKTEYARKGIARGRSVVVLSYGGGILLIAENPSSTLHKVGEIYDRIGFAAVGRYNEFENLRQAGVRYADTRGYSYDRRDVTARGLANAFAQTLGTIFSESMKPFEVEICVAEVGVTPKEDELYRLPFDGSVVDEAGYIVMGGQADVVSSAMRSTYKTDMGLGEAVQVTVAALAMSGAENGTPRTLSGAQLEVAILDRTRSARSFRRVVGAALDSLLPAGTAQTVELPAEPNTAVADGDADPVRPASTMDLLHDAVPSSDLSEISEAKPHIEPIPPGGEVAEDSHRETAEGSDAPPDKPAE